MNSDPMHSQGFCKIYSGIADRQRMYRLFNRHPERPNRSTDDAASLYRGEWFEIDRDGYDRMLEILPPVWMTGDMFALREFLTGTITSVFFELTIDGRTRTFHGYCDMAMCESAAAMRQAIIARERHLVKPITRAEQLEHIWSITPDDYRGYAGENWPEHLRGRRTVLSYQAGRGTVLKLLENLSAAEIRAKLPVHLRAPSEPLVA